MLAVLASVLSHEPRRWRTAALEQQTEECRYEVTPTPSPSNTSRTSSHIKTMQKREDSPFAKSQRYSEQNQSFASSAHFWKLQQCCMSFSSAGKSFYKHRRSHQSDIFHFFLLQSHSGRTTCSRADTPITPIGCKNPGSQAHHPVESSTCTPAESTETCLQAN